MVMHVRFLASSSRLFWICRSLSLSNALVASSEDQDLRIFQEHAGNGDPLLLAAAEPCAALSGIGVVPIRKRHDEFMDVGFLRRVDDLLIACTWPAIGDIFPDRAGEQIDILLNDADGTPQRFQRQSADISFPSILMLPLFTS